MSKYNEGDIFESQIEFAVSGNGIVKADAKEFFVSLLCFFVFFMCFFVVSLISEPVTVWGRLWGPPTSAG